MNTCPWCDAEARPGPGVQRCVGCQKSFTLTAGPAFDLSIRPPFVPPNAGHVMLKWAAVVTYKFAKLEPQGVASGTLDPVIAVATIDEVKIAYADIVSIAVWRKIAWGDLITGLLVPTPIALFFFVLAIASAPKAPGPATALGLIALLFGLASFVLIRRGAVIGNRQARIVGRYGRITVPFKGSTAFHSELFHRSGLVPPPIP